MNADTKQRRCSRCGTLGHTVATCERREARERARTERPTFTVDDAARLRALQARVEHYAAVLAASRPEVVS